MAKGLSFSGGNRRYVTQNLKNNFVLDSKYSLNEVIYETNYYVVAVGTEYDQEYYRTPVREIEIKKYKDLLSKNWNWNLSLKVLNELKLYNTLADQTKMVSLVDIMLQFKTKGTEDEYRKMFNREFRDMYLVFEKYGKDLSYILSSGRKKESPLLEINNNIQQQQWLLSELLSAVSSLHSQKLMHRDLRPWNVCVSFEEKTLKLKSFGLCCGFSSKVFLKEEEENKRKLMVIGGSEITPIYTAPEIILGKVCSPLMDVWSVGCIFAEILSGGSPLFFVAAGSKPTTPNKIGAIYTTLETKDSIDKLSPNPLAIDLLRRMLDFDPDTRISLEAAKQHAYFGGGIKKEELVGESSSSGVVAVAENIGVVEPDSQALRKLIWNEMETFERMIKKKTSEIPLMKKMKT